MKREIQMKTKEEKEYYKSEKRKAIEGITSSNWDELVTLLLRVAFRKGYEAKTRYNRKPKRGEK